MQVWRTSLPLAAHQCASEHHLRNAGISLHFLPNESAEKFFVGQLSKLLKGLRLLIVGPLIKQPCLSFFGWFRYQVDFGLEKI